MKISKNKLKNFSENLENLSQVLQNLEPNLSQYENEKLRKSWNHISSQSPELLACAELDQLYFELSEILKNKIMSKIPDLQDLLDLSE